MYVQRCHLDQKYSSEIQSAENCFSDGSQRPIEVRMRAVVSRSRVLCCLGPRGFVFPQRK